MRSELKSVKKSYQIVLIILILLHQVLQQLLLTFGKLMIDFCVSRDFQRHIFMLFVISGHDNLRKRTFTENLNNFITIAYVVTKYNIVVTFLIVKVLHYFFFFVFENLDLCFLSL